MKGPASSRMGHAPSSTPSLQQSLWLNPGWCGRSLGREVIRVLPSLGSMGVGRSQPAQGGMRKPCLLRTRAQRHLHIENPGLPDTFAIEAQVI